MMIGQYLEQNLQDSDKKVRQGLRLTFCASIELDNGISTTIRFARSHIKIEDGVAKDVDLHMKSSYNILADLLSGKAGPFGAMIKGEVKILKMPLTKPFQMVRLLSFLKIPEELIIRSK